MITVQYKLCDDCGSEVKLTRDARLAHAITSAPVEGDAIGECLTIWEDGLSLVATCPTVRSVNEYNDGEGVSCGNEIYFDGDGAASAIVPGFDSYAEPILMVAP